MMMTLRHRGKTTETEGSAGSGSAVADARPAAEEPDTSAHASEQGRDQRRPKKRRAKKRRPIVYVLLVLVCIVLVIMLLSRCTGVPLELFSGRRVSHDFRCDATTIYHLENGAEDAFSVKAVSVDSDDIEDFGTWDDILALAASLNANTIQAQDVLPPAFYRALSRYNKSAEQKLYVLQRVSLGDEAYTSMTDLFGDRVPERLLKEGKLAIDAVHGRRNSAGYFSDVSAYVIGYVVGDNWDPALLAYSQQLKAGMVYEYTGEYYSCKSSFTYFEAQLAEVLNDLCSYETHKYNHQTPLGLWNWTDTDEVLQTYAFLEDFDGIAIFTQSVVVANESTQVGTFAVFELDDATDPLINMDRGYSTYTDEEGHANPYEAYVRDIVNAANGPVIVADLMVPSSRGVSGVDPISGRNRGGVGESGQGFVLSAAIEDVQRAGAQGVSVPLFDDLSATTWNTERISLADDLWPDVQNTSETLGIVAYEDADSPYRVDGDDAEWAEVEPLISSDGVTLKMAFDAAYVYLDINVPGFDPERDTIYVPLDVTPLSGATQFLRETQLDQDVQVQDTLSFDRAMDFVVKIDGTTNSELLVQRYYDYLYSVEGSLLYDVDTSLVKPSRDSVVFDSIYQYTAMLFRGSDGTEMTYAPAMATLTGKLTYGNGDPDSDAYDSLADYCFGADTIEVRIPWALLNFHDPSSATILGDFFDGDGQRLVHIQELYAGLIIDSGETQSSYASAGFELPGWDEVAYNTRVKESASALADAYANAFKSG